MQGADCIVVGLRKHALNVYDIRAGKRPAFCVDWDQSAVTALAPEAEGSCPAFAADISHVRRLRPPCVRVHVSVS